MKKYFPALVFYIFLFAALASGEKKSTSKKGPGEDICLTCYAIYKKADGWCYDVGGVGTQNCSGSRNFCSFYCASKRGKENTPKSWQKRYN